ncbi:hypothetical protein BOSEA31B_12804 [Hyphomicrobiales bacterium]|nr:hypothetical protein BOSEA31B_12804 [Hyphomicrobiales bacterium]CAH1698576.1 hypothetical protein BOSEA1005_11629 [Hyphomicrobiales bacterium]CAI0342223.1 hypothetical protein BO1005MUT1_180002 [Hyphomicrobiales bacterium]
MTDRIEPGPIWPGYPADPALAQILALPIRRANARTFKGAHVTTSAAPTPFELARLRELPDFEKLGDAGSLSKDRLLAGDSRSQAIDAHPSPPRISPAMTGHRRWQRRGDSKQSGQPFWK